MLAAVADLGGSTVRTALVDQGGQIVAAEQWPTDHGLAAEATMQGVVDGLWRLAGRCQKPISAIRGVGISVAGELDAARGYVYDAVNLGWRDVALTDLVQSLSGKPALIEMDAHAAALGELWIGAGQGSRSLALLIVGTGIGMGLILDGALYRGQGGIAGEFGHTIIQMDGPLCGCGRFGCLEALASGLAIARAARAAVTRGEPTALADLREIAAADVLRAAQEVDRCAGAIVEQSLHALGIGLTNLIHSLSPETIILGGGVALNGGPDWLSRLQTEVDRHLGFWARRVPCRIVLAQLGEHSGLLGMAHRIFESIEA